MYDYASDFTFYIIFMIKILLGLILIIYMDMLHTFG
jgi:hypothetical protein